MAPRAQGGGVKKRFVKAADTTTSVMNSRAQLEKMLRRYGATAFAVSTDYESQKIVVGFKVPDSPGVPTFVPVRLEVGIAAVATALYGPLRGNQSWRQTALEQAERVAWRHLVLWVDAACSASSAGMQTMAEAFFAHVLVKAENGAQGRMFDQWTEHGGAKLLASGEVK
jgi:hypothetical protein